LAVFRIDFAFPFGGFHVPWNMSNLAAYKNLDMTFLHVSKRSHQVWVSDLTYIPLRRRWVFLVAVIDWFSRAVLAWDLSVTRDSKLTTSVDEESVRTDERPPEIINTDQGAEFTASEWVDFVLTSGTLVSQDGRGRALDNRMIESLWWTVKYECVYLLSLETPSDACRAATEFSPYCNERRWHEGLDSGTPWSVLLGTSQDEAGGAIGPN
jgi:putative transposase